MIVVVDTNVLLKMAAARTRSPLFASWQARQTAVAAKVDYLITVDKDLYDDPTLVTTLAEQGIQVVQPGYFQTLLHL